MKSRDRGPGGWRQPPETTAEPVPLRRPYLGPDGTWHQAPAPRPTFAPRPQANRQGEHTARAGSGATAPASPAPGARQAHQRPAPPTPPPAAPPPAAPQGQQRAPEAMRPPALRPPALRRWRPLRAIIGDEVRRPILWCEFGTCIARYTHPEALGERDLRARAQAAGWRYDALGRLACPSCGQHDPAFWAASPAVPGQRYSR